MSIMRLTKVEILATCWKGGSGGGGSSGVVDYPQYMKVQHENMMDGGDFTSTSYVHFTASTCLMQKIEDAVTNSPYSGEVAFDPDADITAFLALVTTLEGKVASLEATSYDDLVTTASGSLDATLIDAAMTAHGDALDDRLNSDVLPRFQVGMRDINAVVSSSFVVGQAVIEAFNTREVADFGAKLRLENHGLIVSGVRDQIQLVIAKLTYRDTVTKVGLEARRMKAVLKKEELKEQLDIDDKNITWGIELFQHGANMLSSISGAAVSKERMPSTGASVLGGALSGAAAGAMVGSSAGPYGAAIGGVIGGIGGLLTS